jgi:sugar phosphate isomerase/epimerase
MVQNVSQMGAAFERSNMRKMKYQRFIVAALGLLISGCATSNLDMRPDANPFFVFDNGVGRGTWTPAQQAQTVKELGFDGIGYNYTNPGDIDKWLTELHSRGLKLFSVYLGCFPDKPDPFVPGMKEAIGKLKGTKAVIWLVLNAPKVKGDYDTQAVSLVNNIADMAKEAGISVVVYPHVGCYAATVEDALRIVNKVNRPNVGVTINLCHELMAGNGQRLDEIIRKAAPRLMMVSVNGADKDTKDLSKCIQTLDRGSFDASSFLKTLQAAGYKGPIGLQCYSIKGDIRENLAGSMAAWKKMTTKADIQEIK